jgi:hypothetical protein
MSDKYRVRRLAIQRKLEDVLPEAAATIEAGSVIRQLARLGTQIVDETLTQEQADTAMTRLLTGSSTAVLEHTRDVFRTTRKLGELHERALTRMIYYRWQEGDRSMTDEAKEAFAEFDASGGGDPVEGDDMPDVVVIVSGPRPLARDSVGNPIMKPSDHVS